ncbi:hypothetical protein BCR33DRAFT_572729 [Rhizoclosmatium globosum]|uniref:Uncharacterized protein n=1 Tax=Rhizoclosmatium globosum TaxID=329046 RepID=A0A1Y2B640_9FUNG|nr:hypothetical protein BCR33DRAFT_572729 [Rhizoclosmatium globosum]|eukprot:ORY29947.1 hypothetical protein BCR33DRAFT_572729 [Rhizoclosmatium globosum]
MFELTLFLYMDSLVSPSWSIPVDTAQAKNKKPKSRSTIISYPFLDSSRSSALFLRLPIFLGVLILSHDSFHSQCLTQP